MYLDPVARETPIMAIGGAVREALRLADVLETMLVGLREAFEKGARRQITETKRLDDILDKLNTAIKAYITSIDPDDPSASIDLAFGVADYFGLKDKEARAIASEIAAVVSDWKQVAEKTGLTRAEMDRMASAFEHDDLDKARAAA